MNGSKKLLALFQSDFSTDEEQDEVIKRKWPKDNFLLTLDILCLEATKYGCSQLQHLEFGPFMAENESQSEDENENGPKMVVSSSVESINVII